MNLFTIISLKKVKVNVKSFLPLFVLGLILISADQLLCHWTSASLAVLIEFRLGPGGSWTTVPSFSLRCLNFPHARLPFHFKKVANCEGNTRVLIVTVDHKTRGHVVCKNLVLAGHIVLLEVAPENTSSHEPTMTSESVLFSKNLSSLHNPHPDSAVEKNIMLHADATSAAVGHYSYPLTVSDQVLLQIDTGFVF